MANPNVEELLRQIAAKTPQATPWVNQPVDPRLQTPDLTGFLPPRQPQSLQEEWNENEQRSTQWAYEHPEDFDINKVQEEWNENERRSTQWAYDHPEDFDNTDGRFNYDKVSSRAPINPDINTYLRERNAKAKIVPLPATQSTDTSTPRDLLYRGETTTTVPLSAEPEPVAAAPEPEPTPAPEAPPDDGRIRTAIGDFMVDENGAKLYNERTGRFHPTSMTAFPSEVTAAIAARKAAKSAAPDEIVDGEDRYKLDKGKPMMFHPKSGSWMEMGTEDLPSMPESVRKAYVESRSAADKADFGGIHDQYYGSTTPRPEQLEENKAKIQSISESMSENQKLQGITTPEQLQVAREQANAALQAAQKTGNAGAIKSLKEHADQLNDMHVIPTPEGGYMAVVKLNGRFEALHTATPKAPTKSGQYDWTKDPQQVAAQAEAMATVDNRRANSQAAGGALLSSAGKSILDTFIGRYAKDYRADQLRGDQPSATVPEVLVDAYKKARDAGDLDGMLDAVKEMQQGLASRYGDIYKSVRPAFIKAGPINEGVMDFSPALVPQQPDRGWNVTSQLLPEKVGKVTPETKLELPDIFGKNQEATEAQSNVQNNFTAQQPTALTRVQQHKAALLKNPTEMIAKPMTVDGRPLDQSNTPSSLLKVSVEDKIKTDRVFADKVIGTVMNGVAAKVAAINLGTMNSGVTETTNADGETSKHVKGATFSKDKEKEILKSLFGLDAHGGSTITVIDKNTGLPARVNMSDPGAMQTATQNFLQLPRAEQEKMMQQGSYWKTIGMLDGLHPKMISTGKGVAPKRHNSRLEIDSQLGDLAGTEIMNASAGLFEEMARELIKQNPEYYRRNAITGNGNANYRPQDVIDALAKNLAQESMIETFTPTMR